MIKKMKRLLVKAKSYIEKKEAEYFTRTENRKKASGVIETILLLIVIVVLCGIFKTEGGNFVTVLFTALTNAANALLS